MIENGGVNCASNLHLNHGEHLQGSKARVGIHSTPQIRGQYFGAQHFKGNLMLRALHV